VYFETALIAYIVDRAFGEFGFIRHPVVLMGDYISWFEKKFYANSGARGLVLTLSLLFITFTISYTIQTLFTFHSSLFISLLQGVIASTAIASKMLYDSVKDIITNPQHIKYLVSRDTEHLSDSDINKAAIETYAENLSDGVIAPLFYLILFGLWGAFVYKAINTLDSVVGYRNERYEKFGKFSAKLDDVVNYIPARVTAILIVLMMPRITPHKTLTHPFPSNSSVAQQYKPTLFTLHSSLLTTLFHQGKGHESPNAGYPITAMALSLGVKLGGDTSYFGKIKSKPFFGEGREVITQKDIRNALALQPRLDIFIIIFVGCCALTTPI